MQDVRRRLIPWRRAIASASLVIAGAGAVNAQTVVVQRAAAGAPVELVLNGTTMATGAAEPGGTATLRMTVTDRENRWRSIVVVLVDTCGATTRIHLVDRDRGGPPPVGACARTPVDGFYLLQAVTTMVIDLGSGRPSMRISQGRAPSDWLAGTSVVDSGASDRMNIYVLGGGGFRNIQEPIDRACGNVTPCSGGPWGYALQGGVGFWIVPYFGVQGDYTHVPAFEMQGSADTYTFTSTFGTDLFTVSGMYGLPLGRLRPFARVGAAHHRAVATTVQVSAPTTVIDASTGEELSDPGGTEQFALETTGWGFLVSGGAEMWATRWLGFYGEATWTFLRGEAEGELEGSTDDRLMLMVGGVRIRLGP